MSRNKFFSSYFISTEELEIEKLIKEEEEQDDGLVFGDLYNETKSKIKDKEEQETEESEDKTPQDSIDNEDKIPEESNDSESGERISGDTETDDDKDSDKEDKHDNKKDTDSMEYLEDKPSKESFMMEHQTSSTESIRLFYNQESKYIQSFSILDTANMVDINRIGLEDISSLYHNTVDNFASSLKHIGFLGIKYTGKGIYEILKLTFKGILYAFDRLAYGLVLSIVAINKYLKRRINSFDRIHKNVNKARETIKLLDDSKVELKDIEDNYHRNIKNINQLIIGNSIDIEENLKVLHSFINNTIIGISASVKDDLTSIRQLIAQSYLNRSDNVYKLLETSVKLNNLHQGTVVGFENNHPSIDSYVSKEVLPGNVVLIAYLPTPGLSSHEEWIDAYKNSDMFFAVDRSRVKSIDEIPYLTKDSLVKLLDVLDGICTTAIEHQRFYESMKSHKLHLRLVYKNYYETLVSRNVKISVKDSLVDMVILKNNFIDKVYIPAAIDMHDYTVRVLNSALTYVEKNIRELTP